MGAKHNSYRFSRVAIWLNVESNPSVTIACSTFRVHELAYRTSPTKYEPISRHISRVDDIETFPVDLPMLRRLRQAMTQLSQSVHREADEYLRQDQKGSHWFFQPKPDGWFAMFDGKPNQVGAFHRWLCDILT